MLQTLVIRLELEAIRIKSEALRRLPQLVYQNLAASQHNSLSNLEGIWVIATLQQVGHTKRYGHSTVS